MDADDLAPSKPRNSPSSSSASTPTQYVCPPSQVYKYVKPVTLKNSDLCLLGDEEPDNFVEASKDPSWKHAMDEELKAIESNGTWTLVTRPPNRKPIGLKWVYKLKRDMECWEYALEAIIKWFISIFMIMIIVYSPCYNCINWKHNTCVGYKHHESLVSLYWTSSLIKR